MEPAHRAVAFAYQADAREWAPLMGVRGAPESLSIDVVADGDAPRLRLLHLAHSRPVADVMLHDGMDLRLVTPGKRAARWSALEAPACRRPRSLTSDRRYPPAANVLRRVRHAVRGRRPDSGPALLEEPTCIHKCGGFCRHASAVLERAPRRSRRGPASGGAGDGRRAATRAAAVGCGHR